MVRLILYFKYINDEMNYIYVQKNVSDFILYILTPKRKNLQNTSISNEL